MKSRTLSSIATVFLLAATTTAACGDGGNSPAADTAAKAHGPINIWYSNNAQEVAWGKQMVEAFNNRDAVFASRQRMRSKANLVRSPSWIAGR